MAYFFDKYSIDKSPKRVELDHIIPQEDGKTAICYDLDGNQHKLNISDIHNYNQAEAYVDKKRFYVTFGIGTLLKGHYMVIIARDIRYARDAVDKIFKEYANIYDHYQWTHNYDKPMDEEYNYTKLTEVEV